MSSSADAPEDEPATRVTPAPAAVAAQRPGAPVRAWLRARPDALVTVALAALLVAVAFTAAGGSSLSRVTWPAIALTLLGTGAVAAAAVLSPPGRRLWGGVTLALFAALAALTAISISWSIQPSDSWFAANLTLAYLAVFAGAMALVRIAPGRWPAIIGAVVLAAIVLSSYSLVTKVFPGIDPLDDVARVRAPFDYWNAVGLMAALGVPGCLWLGARRDGHAALRALSVPALTILLVTVLLSFGRGALLVTLVTCLLWFAVVPLRLRSAAVLGAAGAGTLVVGLWSLANDALSLDGIPEDVRVDAGLSLGLLLLPVLIVMLLAGLAITFSASRSELSRERRLGIGTLLLVLVALVPIGLAGKLAVSDRGLTGSLSDSWHELTDPDAAQPGNDPSRLSAAGGVRARYWDDAFAIWRYSDRTRWTGVGADTFDAARRPLQRDVYRAGHAHGYIPQTLADLGLIGALVNGLLLLAWLTAAARAIALRPRRRHLAWAVAAARARDVHVPAPRREPVAWDAERIGLATLALTAVTFGLHSAVDWTWFVPGTAIVGLLCAGWVAGRGPLAEPPQPARLPHPLRSAPTRLALALLALLVGLAGAWTIWQPQRSAQLEQEAIVASTARGGLPQARRLAEQAADVNPLSIEPLLTLAYVQGEQGEDAQALRTLQRAVELQPANAQTWLALGRLQLAQGDAATAARTLSAAVFLAPRLESTQRALAEALAAGGAVTAPAPAPAP